MLEIQNVVERVSITLNINNNISPCIKAILLDHNPAAVQSFIKISTAVREAVCIKLSVWNARKQLPRCLVE